MCRVELERPVTSWRTQDLTVEIPSCDDCASRYDAQRHGWSQTVFGCWTVGVLAILAAIVVIALVSDAAILVPIGAALIPLAAVAGLLEHRAWRRRIPDRARKRLPALAAEHPTVSELIGQGWRFAEPPTEPSA
jgi:hypothetical protein